MTSNQQYVIDGISSRYSTNNSNTSWIAKFMKNKHYKVKDEGGDGDCFFNVIVSAFKYIGKETTVFKLRQLLANKATDELYQNYKELYTNLEQSIFEPSGNIANSLGRIFKIGE